MLPFASQPHGATLSDSARRTPSEIPSRTRSVSAFLRGVISAGPRFSGLVAGIGPQIPDECPQGIGVGAPGPQFLGGGRTPLPERADRIRGQDITLIESGEPAARGQGHAEALGNSGIGPRRGCVGAGSACPNPANSWIVGRLPGSSGRLEVVTAVPGEPREDTFGPAPFDAGDCICPDFECAHDHANE